MTMTDFSYQLYSSRKFGPLDATLEMVAQCGYKQVEAYSGLYEDLDRLERILAENNLIMPTGHFDLSLIENTPAQAINIANRLGMNAIIVPFLNQEERPSDAHGWVRFSNRLVELAKPVLDAGLTFAWHNHEFEFNAVDGNNKPLDFILEDGNGVSLELDLAWVAVGGENPVEWIKKYGSRLVCVHLKDIAPNSDCESEDGWADVGYGTMDWAGIMNAVRTTNCRYFIMEHDNPTDDMRFAQRSINAASHF